MQQPTFVTSIPENNQRLLAAVKLVESFQIRLIEMWGREESPLDQAEQAAYHAALDFIANSFTIPAFVITTTPGEGPNA